MRAAKAVARNERASVNLITFYPKWPYLPNPSDQEVEKFSMLTFCNGEKRMINCGIICCVSVSKNKNKTKALGEIKNTKT